MSSTLPQPNSCCNLCSGQTVTIDTSGSGTGSVVGWFTAETLDDLRSIPSAATNKWAILLGENAKYDFGPAKEYYWDALNADADNALLVVVPSDNLGGRWVQAQ